MRKFIPYLLSKWTFILFLISVQSLELNAQSMGIFESYSILDINGGGSTYYDCQASTANPDFNGNYFGTLNSSNTLVVKGGETKIYKCGACNVTGTRVYYRVWLTSAGASGSFNQLDTWWDSQVGNSCGSVNQKWLCNNGTTDILSTLTQSGNYTLEIYFAGVR
jgi:hypothetical protein